jgi:hypothetical protein
MPRMIFHRCELEGEVGFDKGGMGVSELGPE